MCPGNLLEISWKFVRLDL